MPPVPVDPVLLVLVDVLVLDVLVVDVLLLLVDVLVVLVPPAPPEPVVASPPSSPMRTWHPAATASESGAIHRTLRCAITTSR
jgi:hypothetical protein